MLCNKSTTYVDSFFSKQRGIMKSINGYQSIPRLCNQTWWKRWKLVFFLIIWLEIWKVCNFVTFYLRVLEQQLNFAFTSSNLIILSSAFCFRPLPRCVWREFFFLNLLSSIDGFAISLWNLALQVIQNMASVIVKLISPFR